MATELAKAYVQIIPSAQGIGGKISGLLTPEAASAGKEAGSAVGSNLISTIKGAIAAAGIGTMIKESLLEGANVQQSTGGIETLFKDSANIVIENAKNAYKTAGMSANEYMETVTGFSASLLQGLAGDTSKAADVAHMALTDMSDNSNKMGSSMESIQNAYGGFAKQNYSMLDNLKLGYGGTKTEMERLLADAQKLTGVKYNIDNLADVYTAIHVIQEQMGITGTTAKEASETFSGSLISMQSAAKNVMANLALGENVNKSLSELRGTAETFLFRNFLPMLGNVISSVPDVVGNALSFVVTGMEKASENTDKIVNGVTTLVKDIAYSIVSLAPRIAESGIELIKSFASSIMNFDWLGLANDFIIELDNGISLGMAESFGAEEGIVDFLLNSITAKLPDLLNKGVEITTHLVNGIFSKIPDVINSASQIGSTFITFILQNLPIILSSGQLLVRNLVSGIISNLPSIATSAVQAVSTLIGTITNNSDSLVSMGNNMLQNVVSGILARIPNVIQSATNIVSTFIAFVLQNLPAVLSSGTEVIGSLARGIINSLPSIATSAVQAVDTLLGTILNNAPILLSAGIELLGKVVNGIINSIPTLINTAFNLITELRNTLWNHAPQLLESGIILIGQLIAGILRAIPNLINQIPSIVNSIANQFYAMDWITIGRNIIDGIIRGLKNAGGLIVQAAKDVGASALNSIKGVLGIHSPSRIFENEVGKMIDMGLALGIEDNVGEVSKAMKTLSKETIGSIDSDFDSVLDTRAIKTVKKDTSSSSADRDSEGVIIEIINQVTVDGTPLKEKVSQYTIRKITEQQNANLRVRGA